MGKPLGDHGVEFNQLRRVELGEVVPGAEGASRHPIDKILGRGHRQDQLACFDGKLGEASAEKKATNVLRLGHRIGRQIGRLGADEMLQRLGDGGVAGIARQRAPDGEQHRAAGTQHTAHLAHRLGAVAKELDALEASDEIDAGFLQRQNLRARLMPDDRRRGGTVRHRARNRQHALVAINPGDMAARPYRQGEEPRADACAAGDVERALARLGRAQRQRQPRPGREDARHQEFLVGLAGGQVIAFSFAAAAFFAAAEGSPSLTATWPFFCAKPR